MVNKTATINYFLRIFLFTIIVLFCKLNTHAQNAIFSFTQSSNCVPASVNFTNTSTGATDYSWDFGNGNISSVDNPSANFNTAGTFTVTLIASNGTNSSTSTEIVTVYALPIPDYSLNVSSVCTGQAVTFTDNSTSSSGAIASWVWDFGDGNGTTNTSGNTTHTYSNNGTFFSNLTVTTIHGCSNTFALPIDVNNSPVANFTASPRNSCSIPTDVVFTNNSTSDGNATYSWDFDGGTSSLASPPSFQYTNFGNYSVSLTVTENGCTNTLTEPNYINIATITPNFSATATTVCIGETITFNESITSSSRTWDFGDGTTQTIASPNHSYNAEGTYTISLLDVNGCGLSEIKNNYITVLPLPTAEFSISDTASCSVPFAVNFTDNSIGADSWMWNFGDGNTSAVQNPSHTYSSIGSNDVSLTVTNSNGCSNTINKDNAVIISPFTPTFISNVNMGCTPLSVDFTSLSQSIASPIVLYEWDFGDGTTASSTLPTITNTYTSNNSFDVKLTITSESGCRDSVTFQNFIQAGDRPTANFDVVTPLICYGTEAEFTDLSTGADSAYWNFGNNQGVFSTPEGASLPFNPVVNQYQDTGTFSVRQIVFNNGCADTLVINDAITILPPDPEFSFQLNCTDPYAVDFTDASIGADSLIWDFGDGSPLVINDTTPTHIFGARGVFLVSLTAYNLTHNCSETFTLNITIAEPIASATINSDTSCYGTPVLFTDNSQDQTSVRWNFGDGTTGTNSPINKTYNSPGEYTVEQIITDINGCHDSINHTVVIEGAIPDFNADTVRGCKPFLANFTDNSTSDSSLTNWSWDFGDGSPIETTENPTINHSFTNNGVYSVTMSVTDKNGCTHSITKTNYIESIAPEPLILADTFSCLNTTILFDGSTSIAEEPANFIWNFGDGTPPSNARRVTHSYVSEGIYTVSLTIIDNFGCDSTSQHSVRIEQPNSNFDYTIVSESCGNSQIQFTDQSIGTSIVNWEWNFGDLGTAFQQNPTHTYTSPGNFSTQLITTNLAGCSDSITIDNILVPGPTGSFTMTPTIGCAPLEVTFTAVSNNTTAYIWDFGDGNTATTSDSIVMHTYILGSSPTPNLILESLVNGEPCNTSAPSVEPITVIDIKIDIDSIFNTTCNGTNDGSAYISANGGSLPYSYQWSRDINDTLDSIIDLIPGDYSLTVVDTNNCSADTTISIEDTPIIVSATGDNDTVCPNTNGTLTTSASGGNGIFTYLWQPVNIENTGTLITSSPASTTYSVTAIDQNGCMGEEQTTSLIVYSLDTVTLSTSGNSPICSGQNTTINTQLTGFTGPVTYQWSPAIGTDGGPVIVNPVSPTNYEVTITNICGDVINDAIFIAITPPPIVNIGSEQLEHCISDSIYFDDFSTTPTSETGTITQWFWDFGDGNTSTLQSPSHIYESIGIHNINLTVITDSGCTASNRFPVTTVTSPYPKADFEQQSPQLTVPIAFLNLNNKSIGATSYLWDFGDNNDATDFNPNHKYEEVGNYTIQLIATSDEGCSDTTTRTVIVDLTPVFPNAFTPNTDISNGGRYNINDLSNDVFFPFTSEVAEYQLEIYNRWGELVFQSNDFEIGWDGYYKNTPAIQDVYVWKAYFKFFNGRELFRYGDVTLLR